MCRLRWLQIRCAWADTDWLARQDRRRKLDDVELDSGDDEGRYDRAGSPMEEDCMDYGRTLNIMDLSLGRAPEPETTDGQVGSPPETSTGIPYNNMLMYCS